MSTHKLRIDEVTKVVVEGNVTTIHVKEGSAVEIDFTFPTVEGVEVAAPTEEVKPVAKKATPKPKATAPKKEAVVKKEEPVEMEEEVSIPEIEPEDLPFDVEELAENVVDQKGVLDEDEGGEEGFTELEKEEIISINDVFSNSSTTVNATAKANAEDAVPKKTGKSNVFGNTSTKATDEEILEKKKAFNF